MTRGGSGIGRRLVSIFFGASACSWMPHAALHYHRLETKSSFIIGTHVMTRRESYAALFILLLLVGFNLACIRIRSLRGTVALFSGLGHTLTGCGLILLLFDRTPLVVLDYAWTRGASFRLALLVLPFGLISLALGAWLSIWRRSGS